MKNTFSYIFGIAILVSGACTKTERKLPILGNREPVEKVVNGKTVTDTVYQTIPEFSFLNQDSTVITGKDFDGSIYIADFFFTSCPSICPVMHRNMLKIYEKYKGNNQVKFLSHSIDFKYDTPSRLKEYAAKLGASAPQWQFAHGSKEDVYTLAEKNYLVAVEEDNRAPGGFVHQGWFILVDKHKRLRGAYDGTDTRQTEQLTKDIGVLLAEEQ
jgi:protein SCO1